MAAPAVLVLVLAALVRDAGRAANSEHPPGGGSFGVTAARASECRSSPRVEFPGVHRAPCTMHPMATMKRRIVYLSDDQWARLLAEAASRERTVSALIRDCLEDGRSGPAGAERGEPSGGQPKGAGAGSSGMPRGTPFTPAPKPSQRRP